MISAAESSDSETNFKIRVGGAEVGVKVPSRRSNQPTVDLGLGEPRFGKICFFCPTRDKNTLEQRFQSCG